MMMIDRGGGEGGAGRMGVEEEKVEIWDGLGLFYFRRREMIFGNVEQK